MYIVTSDGAYAAHNGIFGPFMTVEAACEWVSKQEMDGYHDLAVRPLTFEGLEDAVAVRHHDGAGSTPGISGRRRPPRSRPIEIHPHVTETPTKDAPR